MGIDSIITQHSIWSHPSDYSNRNSVACQAHDAIEKTQWQSKNKSIEKKFHEERAAV